MPSRSGEIASGSGTYSDRFFALNVSPGSEHHAIVTNTQYDDGGRSREEAKQKAPDLVYGQIRGSPYPAWEDRQAGMN